MSQQQQRVYNSRYEIVRHVARGGMAEVYLAHDLLLDRPVALKVLFPELSVDPSFVERFRREAQAAANLSHPNIVSVYDWGEEDNTYFIVMEFVDGRPLSALLRSEGPVAADRAAGIGAEVAGALAFAHRNGVVHRDVKPGNVLINDEGTVKVADFGIARATSTTENLTQTGAVMGTATYFSPEQAQGSVVDARSDVYSLGVVLYEMASGRPPFSGDNPVTIAYKHVREEPEPLRHRNPAVPAAFEAIVMRAMAKRAENRYASADDLRADLIRFRQGREVAAGPVMSEATQAVGATTMMPGYGGDDGRVMNIAHGSTAAIPLAEPPRRRTEAYVALLVLLLLGLAGLLFLLGRQLGVFGGSTAKQLNVPQVIGLDATAAEDQLKGQGFQVKQDLQPNDVTAQGKVFDQDPKPGTKVDKGALVTIKVSSGSAPAPVPNQVGQNVDDATAALEAAGFNVTTEQRADDRRPEGTVLAQDPKGGTTANRGTTVKLTVSTGPAKVSIPSETSKDATDAANELGNLGVKVVTRTQPSDTVAQGKVITTEPPAGSQVAKGSTVTLVVSSGPQPTTTTPIITIPTITVPPTTTKPPKSTTTTSTPPTT